VSVIVRRLWAPLHRYTFKSPVVAELLGRYVGDGRGWADPFAGLSVHAEYRNDPDPSTPRNFRWEVNRGTTPPRAVGARNGVGAVSRTDVCLNHGTWAPARSSPGAVR
jgi:hypothetical protein